MRVPLPGWDWTVIGMTTVVSGLVLVSALVAFTGWVLQRLGTRATPAPVAGSDGRAPAEDTSPGRQSGAAIAALAAVLHVMTETDAPAREEKPPYHAGGGFTWARAGSLHLMAERVAMTGGMQRAKVSRHGKR